MLRGRAPCVGDGNWGVVVVPCDEVTTRYRKTKAKVKGWYTSATLLGFAALGTVCPGKEVTVVTSGPSMRPTLPVEATKVVIETEVKWSDLKKGDIVAYRRKDGEYTVHRLFKKVSPKAWWARGDGNPLPDREYVTEGNLYGKVVGVWRKDGRTGTVALERGGI